LHHVIGLHFVRLIQRSEFNLLGRLSIVDERWLNAVQIVRTDGDQGSITAEILVKLLLEFDETLIAVRVELNVTKHGTDNDRANALRLERGHEHVRQFASPREAKMDVRSAGLSCESSSGLWPVSIGERSVLPSWERQTAIEHENGEAAYFCKKIFNARLRPSKHRMS
jgi:hypothetical protein